MLYISSIDSQISSVQYGSKVGPFISRRVWYLIYIYIYLIFILFINEILWIVLGSTYLVSAVADGPY